MSVGIFVNYAQPAQVVSFPVDTPATVELRVLSVLTQTLIGLLSNGSPQQDELRVLRNDQSAPGN